MLWGRNVADRLRLESHTQQCYGEGTIYDTQRLLLMKYGSELHQQQCWRKDCCWQVQIRIASANMLKRGKECCRQAQITDTSAAVLCGRNFAGRLRAVTQTAMLKWGRNVAGRLRSGTHRKQCYGEGEMLPGSSYQGHARSNVREGEMLTGSSYQSESRTQQC